MDLSTEEITAGSVSSLGDIYNMKVVDLKKELKVRGLPLTGNKTELIDRLLEAEKLGKDLVPETSDFKGFEEFTGESSERISGLNSQEALTDSFFDDSLSSPEKSFKEVPKLPDLPTESSLSSDMSRPLKKRVIAAKDNDHATVEKKLQLNRSHPVPTSVLTPTPEAPVTKPVNQNRKLITVSTDKNGDAEQRISSMKILTESERLAKRAERFNVKSDEVTNKDTKLVSSAPKVSNKPSTLSDTSNTADLDVLKKRAERFGQSVSTVMKQLEEKEKILKRKLKFGASAAASSATGLNEKERKKKRAERFGNS